MSIVLSIYSQKGFREVTLPERGQSEIHILLEKELFALDRDLSLDMERREGEWILRVQGASVLRDKEIERNETAISANMNLKLETVGGQRITVISYEQSDPFSVYGKYSLTGLQKIDIGRNEENDIRYQNDFVSGQHCTIHIQGEKATLTDTSTNGTYLNFRRVYGTTVLNYGDSIRIMRLNIIYLGNMLAIGECDGLELRLDRLRADDIGRHMASSGRPDGEKTLFHRSPRNLHKLHTEPFEIEAPPNPSDQKERPLGLVIGPSLTMAIPMLLGSGMSILASRSSGASAGAFMYMGIVTAIASAIIGTVWAILNVRSNAKMRREAERRRQEAYSDYLIDMRDRIAQACGNNAAALNDRYLSAEACCTLDASSPLLWNRNPSHEDFLGVRLGMGDIPFQAEIAVPKERFTLIDDYLAEKPGVIKENLRILRNVPVTVDLLEHRLVGVAGGGSRKNAISAAKSMIAQLAASNSYTEVKIGIVYDERNDLDREAWEFARWLPHVWASDKKTRYIATNRAEMDDVFYALTQTLRDRSEERDDRSGRRTLPRFVLLVSDPKLLDGEPVSRYIFDRGADLGLSTVLLADTVSELPNDCEWVIENATEYQGIYNTLEGRENGTRLQFDRSYDEALRKFAKTLGRIEVVEAEQEGDIPNALTFFDLYGVSRPEELVAAQRWKKANSTASMRALVGFRGGNTPCYLDIHERYQGPHGLVAGTTGSGKSETLQTYILSLAVNFSPEDVGFFIIDYKGGGMANLFDGLPHMIGSISNLSGNQVKRAMVSIQSENRRRQRIFTEYGINNINGYTTLYKNGDANEPIPHLFIIIDEFAELKREEPEFMKELISVAQVGRSLGVHLILSTQRPSGTVDENIWANSKFRLCLRVQDRQDSMDMLHRPEAAYLTQAGRCYLQVGNDEIFELFQSGWSGADYDEELGGGNLLIAQMLSASGKVDLAGNHAKIKRKEELKRKWAGELIAILRDTEKETGISVSGPEFRFEEQQIFLKCFYHKIRERQPEFEETQFNTARIGELCAVYRELDLSLDESALAGQLVRRAAREGKRLPEVKSKTQLEVVVDYLGGVARELGVEKMRKLWLPVLPEYLYLDDIEQFRRVSYNGADWPERPKRFRLSAVIGMADDPANQAQMPAVIDFTAGGHHMLTGTVSTGKSTFLQTVIYSLAMSYTPDLLNIYCLDFSAKMLSVFSELKHVGGYMDESDLETNRINKFFNMIQRILDERKLRFAGTSYEDYINHNGWTVPAILLVIDNYGSFHEKTGEAYEPIMARLAKEGVGYGIYLLTSSAGIGMQELPGRLAENFRTGISLEMQDMFAYGDVLHIVRPPVLPEARVKGRGIMYVGEDILEFQTALAAHAEGGPERNDLITAAVERMNAAYAGPAARPVPTIPAKPTRADFTARPEYAEAVKNPALMPVGYEFESADIWSFDLVRNYAFLVTGARQSGKSVLMENLILTSLEKGGEVFIAETGGDRFARIAEDHQISRCGDAQGVYDMLSHIHQEMLGRSKLKRAALDRKSSDEELFQDALQNPRISVFIADMLSFVTMLNDRNSPAFGAKNLFDALCERGKGYNIFLYGEVSDKDQAELMGYSAFEFLRNYRSGIRFGGRFGDQRLFSFENVRYQDQEKSMKPGIGVIPSDDRDDPLLKIVVPLS